ncbi:ATP-binding protein [Kitasatospora sp. NPDC007106]|uniref:ATP-binding protein n=1 Tax=Kitasatospora sp. NPDC007106 TaxID=3156914 RepID=UPI003406C479
MMWIARFPGVPESVRAARRMVREALGPSAGAEDAALVVSELVTNAVVHSRSGAGGVLWVEVRRRHGTVRVSVTDGGTADGPAPHGPPHPLPHRPPVDAGDFGRGLRIVDALAARWGSVGEAADGRRTVWAELAPARGGGPPERTAGPADPAGPAAPARPADDAPAPEAEPPSVPPQRCRLCGTPRPPRQGAAVTAWR